MRRTLLLSVVVVLALALLAQAQMPGIFPPPMIRAVDGALEPFKRIRVTDPATGIIKEFLTCKLEVHSEDDVCGASIEFMAKADIVGAPWVTLELDYYQGLGGVWRLYWPNSEVVPYAGPIQMLVRITNNTTGDDAAISRIVNAP